MSPLFPQGGWVERRRPQAGPAVWPARLVAESIGGMRRSRPTSGPRRDIGLALRADRRRRGKSQRAYAEERSISRKVLATVEVDAGAASLACLVALLEGTGFELTVSRVESPEHDSAQLDSAQLENTRLESAQPEPEWDPTDLDAFTRSGSRFPAHRPVRRSAGGPLWWWYHEMLGSRGDGPQPGWTAEGFTPPPGTRYGKKPRSREEGEGSRWPY